MVTVWTENVTVLSGVMVTIVANVNMEMICARDIFDVLYFFGSYTSNCSGNGNCLKTGIVNVQMDSLGLIAQLVSFNSKNVDYFKILEAFFIII